MLSQKGWPYLLVISSNQLDRRSRGTLANKFDFVNTVSKRGSGQIGELISTSELNVNIWDHCLKAFSIIKILYIRDPQVLLYIKIISFKKNSGTWTLFAFIFKQISGVIVMHREVWKFSV